MKKNNEELTTIMCGISTGVSVMSFTAWPVILWLWFVQTAAKSPKNAAHYIILLSICGAGAIASIVASSLAKAWNRKSRWAVFNIIFIGIGLVLAGLMCWGFIALITKAMNYS